MRPVRQTALLLCLLGASGLGLPSVVGDVSASAMQEDGFRPYRARGAEAVEPASYLTALGLDPASYDEARFDESLGALVVTGIRPSGGEGELSIARAEIFAPDAEAAAALQGSGSELQSPFERLRLYDVTFAKDACASGEAEGCGPDADPAARSEATTLRAARLEVQGFALRPAASEGEEDAAAALSALSFGAVTVHDAVAEAGGGRFSAGRLTMDGYEAGRLGSVSAENLESRAGGDQSAVRGQLAEVSPALAGIANGPLGSLFFPDDARVTLASLRWEGMSVERLLPYLASDETPPPDADDLISVGGAELRDQKTYVNGKLAQTVARTSLSDIAFRQYMPERFSAESRGVVTDYSAYLGEEQADLAAVLEAQGLTEVKGNSRVDYAYDPEADSIRLTSEGVADDLLTTRFTLLMSSFDHAAVLGEAEDALSAAALDEVTLVLEDENMIEALFAVYGAMQEQDPAELRQGAAGTVTIAAMQGKALSPRVPGYAEAVSRFVAEGGTLTISVDPAEPVPFGSLKSLATQPSAVVETLNLTVERTE